MSSSSSLAAANSSPLQVSIVPLQGPVLGVERGVDTSLQIPAAGGGYYYLGELIRLVLLVHNLSPKEVHVSTKVTVCSQNKSNVLLLDTEEQNQQEDPLGVLQTSKGYSIPSNGKPIELLVSHRFTELGPHQFTCSTTLHDSSSGPRIFHKTLTIDCSKLFRIFTKCEQLPLLHYLVQVQAQACSEVFVQGVVFTASPEFTQITSLESTQDPEKSFLCKDESLERVFKLTRADPLSSGETSLGSFRLSWSRPGGATGHLSSPAVRVPKHFSSAQDVLLKTVEIPTDLRVGKPFGIRFSICMDRLSRALYDLEVGIFSAEGSEKDKPIIGFGKKCHKIGVLKSGEAEFTLQFIALSAGFHTIDSIVVRDQSGGGRNIPIDFVIPLYIRSASGTTRDHL